MAFLIKRKQVDYMALDKGTYPARLVGIIGIGEQIKTFKDKPQQLRDMVVLLFEIVGFNRRHKNGTEFMVEVNGQQLPEPQTVRRECVRSLSANSNLVRVLSSLIPIPADVSELDIEAALMMPCLVSLDKRASESSGNEYNVVEAISPPIVGMDIPPARMQPILYDVETHTDESFNALPEWLQDEVRKSTQWADMHANSTPIATAPPHVQCVEGQTVNTRTGEVYMAQPMQGFMQAPGQIPVQTPVQSAIMQPPVAAAQIPAAQPMVMQPSSQMPVYMPGNPGMPAMAAAAPGVAEPVQRQAVADYAAAAASAVPAAPEAYHYTAPVQTAPAQTMTTGNAQEVPF